MLARRTVWSSSLDGMYGAGEPRAVRRFVFTFFPPPRRGLSRRNRPPQRESVTAPAAHSGASLSTTKAGLACPRPRNNHRFGGNSPVSPEGFISTQQTCRQQRRGDQETTGSTEAITGALRSALQRPPRQPAQPQFSHSARGIGRGKSHRISPCAAHTSDPRQSRPARPKSTPCRDRRQ